MLFDDILLQDGLMKHLCIAVNMFHVQNGHVQNIVQLYCSTTQQLHPFGWKEYFPNVTEQLLLLVSLPNCHLLPNVLCLLWSGWFSFLVFGH